MNCPLCGKESNNAEVIDKNKLVLLWRKLGIDIESLLSYDFLYKKHCGNCGLGFYDPPCSGNDDFYGELAKWDWYYKHPGKSEYIFAASKVTPTSKLIDVGCGIGEFSTYLPFGAEFLGIELSSKSVEIAQALNRNVQKIDISNAPENYNSYFDIVTCFQVLEHIVDIHEFFDSLVKLCKKDGLLILAVPNNDGFVGDAINNAMNMPPHHVLLWNKRSLHYLAKTFNLKVVEYIDEPLSEIHRHWACTTKINKFILNKLKIDSTTINDSFLFKFLNKISSLSSRLLCLTSLNSSTPGHSSIIVLKKI